MIDSEAACDGIAGNPQKMIMGSDEQLKAHSRP